MRLSDIVNGPWMITEPMLSEIQSIYSTHMRGEKIDLAGVEARIGRPLESNQERGYQVTEHGVAVITVDGSLAKRANLMHRMSGGASYQIIEQSITAALSDPSVAAIALAIDSPGGTVDGAFELADFVRRAGDQKPIYAYSDGMMCSGAYLLAAACQSVTLLAPGATNAVGSIGVIATHEYRQKEGVKTTQIVSGRYKALGSPNRELGDEALAVLQADVDYVASQFIESIADWRGLEPAVVAGWEARTFTGQQAVEVGLVDGVSTLDDLLTSIAGGVPARSQKPAIKEQKPMSDQKMSIESLKADHPELFRAAVEEGKKIGMAEGATIERERIKSVQAQFARIPGHAELAEQLMFDGQTTGGDAAMQILDAERVKLSGIAGRLSDEAPAPIAASEPDQSVGSSHKSPEDQAKNWEKLGFANEANCLSYLKLAAQGRIVGMQHTAQGV